MSQHTGFHLSIVNEFLQLINASIYEQVQFVFKWFVFVGELWVHGKSKIFYATWLFLEFLLMAYMV